MHIVTLDFETYWDQASGYTLSKMTTEAYIRDPRFQAVVLCMSVDGEPLPSLEGPQAIAAGLEQRRNLIESSAVLAHHAHFDGLILSHHFNLTPKVWLDTLSMARALLSHKLKSLSLEKLLEHFGLGRKGDEVLRTSGMCFKDFTPEQLQKYTEYCQNDVDRTYELFLRLVQDFPADELKIIDTVVRMFTEPTLTIRSDLLRQWIIEMRERKEALLKEAGVELTTLMSNAKFADALTRLGVAPPMKVSPTTGKPAFAFAKTDEGLMELREHEDERVQVLVEARLGNKSTINETRAVRMAEMGERGAACIYLKYSGATQTHRLSGGDSMNWQNLTKTRPPRPPQDGVQADLGRMVVTPDDVGVVAWTTEDEVGTMDGSVYPRKRCHLFGLRDALEAPAGHALVVVDSANIEARILDTLAGQQDAVQRYRDKQDPYIELATAIYGRLIDREKDPNERQLGKVAKLGFGFGMGKEKAKTTVKAWGLEVPDEIVESAVDVYRERHPYVRSLWYRLEECFPAIISGTRMYVDPGRVLQTVPGGIRLPHGLDITYHHLRRDPETREWKYWNGRYEAHVYGGKATENVVQGLAYAVVGGQMAQLAKRWWVAHFIHDELILVVPLEEQHNALYDAVTTMQMSPTWWPALPLDAEGKIGLNYGRCK